MFLAKCIRIAEDSFAPSGFATRRSTQWCSQEGIYGAEDPS